MRKKRVIVIEKDMTILNLLDMYLSRKGYEVVTYTEPSFCPMYGNSNGSCRHGEVCADVIMADNLSTDKGSVLLIQKQSRNGCRLHVGNKALLFMYLDNNMEKIINHEGCSYFIKPFRLSEIGEWLNECEKHIDLSKVLIDL